MLYGLVDCNNFYCSCERVFRPDLAGRPVVVLSNNDGCVVALTQEAKDAGIRRGDPFFKVSARLEAIGAAVFSSNYELYGDMSRRVMSILAAHTDRLQVYSIDEAFMELDGIPDVAAFGRRIAREVARSTGIPVSIGIAPTRTLAKVASRFAKRHPGYRGACLIDTAEKREKALSLTAIADVWGIGRRMAARLESSGVRTALDFTRKPEQWVRRNFTVTGWRTWSELRGVDCIDVEELPMKRSICTSRSFAGQGLSDLRDMEGAVAGFAASCADKLRRQGSYCGAITVFAWTSPFREDLPADYFQEMHRFAVQTDDTTEIVSAALDLLRARWREGCFYKKAGVLATEICGPEGVSTSLFDEVDRDRSAALMKVIDAINAAQGKDTVRTAVQDRSVAGMVTREHLSPQYTTDVDDVIVVKV